MTICKLLMSFFFRLHVLANTEDNSDTGDIELIRHLHVNVSSLKILLQGTTYDYYYYFSSSSLFLFLEHVEPTHDFKLCWKQVSWHENHSVL